MTGIYSFHSTSEFPKGLLPFSTDTPVDCQRDRQASQIGCFLAGGKIKKLNYFFIYFFMCFSFEKKITVLMNKLL